jgi:hypothetical protein
LGKRYFKVHTSIQNHRKADFWTDPMLRGMWVAIGVLAVERYADRTDDRFLLSSGDLLSVTGATTIQGARSRMARLEAQSTLTITLKAPWYEAHLPNFAKKHNFGEFSRTNRKHHSDSDSYADSKGGEEPPPAPPSKPSEKAEKSRGASPPPARLEPEDRSAIARWFRDQDFKHLDEGDLGRLWEECADHFRAKGVRRKDWPATFRNWVRRAEGYAAERPGPQGPPASGGYHHRSPPKPREEIPSEELAEVAAKLENVISLVGRRM